MILLVVVAAVLVLLATGLLTTCAVLSRRESKELVPFEATPIVEEPRPPVPLAAGPAPKKVRRLYARRPTDLQVATPEPEPPLEEAPVLEPMELTQIGGQDVSWNDLVFQRLKAHYPDLDGSINDYLYRYQQDNS